jgi:hypothetical protein
MLFSWSDLLQGFKVISYSQLKYKEKNNNSFLDFF